MKHTQQIEELTKEEIGTRAKVGELCKKLSELVRNSFIGTYKVEDTSIIMRIPNGQKFRISVEEITQ